MYQLFTISSFEFYKSSVSVKDYANRAKKLGYSGIGICDNNIYSYPYLSDECEKNSLKPLFGYRFFIKNSSQIPFEAILYIKNETGYLSLCKILASKKDIFSIDSLKECDGLILILTIDSNFFDEKYLKSHGKDFLSYQKVFKNDFYFGISLYSNEDKENAINLYDFLNDFNYQSIALPKVEYIKKDDAYKKSLLENAKNVSADSIVELEETGPYFLLSENALTNIYREEDIKRLDELVSKIDFTFFKERGSLIHFENEDDELKKEAYEGLKKRFQNNLNQKYIERLEYELKIIKQMRFSSYFLIVSDYVKYAKSLNIKVGPGRGSAASSLVSFSLFITEVDPIRFDLTFERFLNPDRVSMPDIDIDFEDERRDEVVKYLTIKYGEDKVSDIVTFSKLKPKSSINLIGPVLNINPNRLKKITSSISDKASDFKSALSDEYKGNSLKELLKDPYYKDIVKKAEGILSLPINTSIHAPGVIISSNPIHLSCPRKSGTTGTVLFEYPTMERLGFLKVDILSLSNLTFIKHIEEDIIKDNLSLPNIYNDLENPAVYKTLCDEKLSEIFQLDTSYGMKKTIRSIKPSCFNELNSAIALFRPGPEAYIESFANRKHGREKITYIDERLKPILDETYGIMVYQEQIMKVLQVVANFSLSEADLFRRAISKKQVEKMNLYKSKFIKGCNDNGISFENAEKIFLDIEKFAQYGYNKAHTISYSLITYTLLYYKTLYPIQFYKNALKNESFSSKKMDLIIEELTSIGYVVKNPNINISLKDEFLFKDKMIYLPLKFIQGNESLIESIIKNRNERNYTSFYDFIYRNKDVLTDRDARLINSIIDSGALDKFSKSRLAMKENYITYLEFAKYNLAESSIPSLCDNGEDIGEMLSLEKLALGKILSVKLNRIFYKSNYHTYIVTDTSMKEMYSTVTIDDEKSQYKIRIKDNNINKYDFILVQGQLPYLSKGIIENLEIINCKRKVVKHE